MIAANYSIPEERSGLDLYLDQLGRTPLLSAAEEARLAWTAREGAEAQRRIDAGDDCPAYRAEAAAGRAARDELIRRNLRLVVKIAKKYRQRNVELDDLIQFGNLGLMTAIDKFDPERGLRLSTMATHWIRQSITRNIADTARTVRLPVHMVETVQKVYGFVMECGGGRAPTAADIALALDIPEKRVQTALENLHLAASLDAAVGDEGDTTLGAFVPADDDTETEATHEVMRADVRAVLSRLGERERLIITLRFGLDGGERHTLEAIGAVLGVTRERVRQIEAEALRRLRHPAYGGMLRGWLR